MKTAIILLKILIVGALLIISNGNLAMKNQENLPIFFERYNSWLTELFDKGAVVMGYVISTEWLPDKELSQNEVSIEG
jgi:hypothetical protein